MKDETSTQEGQDTPLPRRRKCENGTCPEAAYFVRLSDNVPVCPKCAKGRDGLVSSQLFKKLLGYAKWDAAFVRAMAKKGGQKISELGIGHRYTSETGRIASRKAKQGKSTDGGAST